MKILKNKEKSGFKGTFLKIGVVVLIVFMIFGVMKSCVKVNAEISVLSVGNYTFDEDLRISTLQHIDPKYQGLSIFSTTTNEVWFSCNGMDYVGMKFELTGDSSTGYVFALYYLQRLVVGNGYSNVPIRVYFNTNVPQSGINESTWLDTSWRNITILNASVVYWYSGAEVYGFDYLAPILTITDLAIIQNQFYTDGYNAGFSAGKDTGIIEGFNEANLNATTMFQDMYNKGYQAGLVAEDNPYRMDSYNAGYDDGYSDGFEDDKPYTFKKLFFAVLEVPVQTFTGLFNWNFLGYNLADFVFSILSLSVIVFIVRKLI